MMDLNESLRDELEREASVLAEGDYEAEIIGLGDIQYTRSKQTPYLPVGLLIGTFETRDFQVGSITLLNLLKSLEDKITGMKVRVRVKHRSFGDRMYVSPSILEVIK